MKVYDNYNLIGEELDYKLSESKKILSEANPDFLIKSLDELPRIIRFLNHYK